MFTFNTPSVPGLFDGPMMPCQQLCPVQERGSPLKKYTSPIDKWDICGPHDRLHKAIPKGGSGLEPMVWNEGDSELQGASFNCITWQYDHLKMCLDVKHTIYVFDNWLSACMWLFAINVLVNHHVTGGFCVAQMWCGSSCPILPQMSQNTCD